MFMGFELWRNKQFLLTYAVFKCAPTHKNSSNLSINKNLVTQQFPIPLTNLYICCTIQAGPDHSRGHHRQMRSRSTPPTLFIEGGWGGGVALWKNMTDGIP